MKFIRPTMPHTGELYPGGEARAGVRPTNGNALEPDIPPTPRTSTGTHLPVAHSHNGAGSVAPIPEVPHAQPTQVLLSNSGQLPPQPSQASGVPQDMATLVVDNTGLMAGSRLSPAYSGKTQAGAAREAQSGPKSDGLPSDLGSVEQPGASAARSYAVEEDSDAAIMLRVAAGDESGFNYLVGKYHRQIVHFLFRMVHNQAVAEELAQEVFLRVYRSRESYRAEAKFTTWVYRIATNLAVNHVRDTKHERAAHTIYLDEPDAESGSRPDLADDGLNVEQRIVREERMAAIRAHVMALPERQRMAVLMHKYQGMDYRQIGEVLKLSESATKSLLFRAYQTLREKLKDFV